MNITSLIPDFLDGSITEKYDFDEKTIKSQKLIRKIQDPVSTLTNLPTPRGKTGILVNGVEILNYKWVYGLISV